MRNGVQCFFWCCSCKSGKKLNAIPIWAPNVLLMEGFIKKSEFFQIRGGHNSGTKTSLTFWMIQTMFKDSFRKVGNGAQIGTKREFSRFMNF